MTQVFLVLVGLKFEEVVYAANLRPDEAGA